jgi:preprotein translocase subunit SecY
MKLFEAIANVFRIPDLRKRVLFLFGHACRLPAGQLHPHARHRRQSLDRIPQPAIGLDLRLLRSVCGRQYPALVDFALGIMPYITSSIILQLLTVVVPTLEKLQKEGELGRRKITQWTRYLTVGLGIAASRSASPGLQGAGQFVIHPGIGFILMTILTLTTGTAFIMWLGEQITERGVGNGMSLIIFTGIVVGLPNAIRQHLYNTPLRMNGTASR